MNSPETFENKMLSRIYGYGRGWVFSKKGFARLGDVSSIDRTLSRMAEKGLIRRVIRGLYDYPTYSKLLKNNSAPISPKPPTRWPASKAIPSRYARHYYDVHKLVQTGLYKSALS